MVFSSVTFLLYFLPILLSLYFLADSKYRNAVLLAASIIFYAWGAPKFIFVILGTTFLDFFLVNAMDKSKEEWRRKLLLVLSVSMNVSLLFYFKYFNFCIDNINRPLYFYGLGTIQWERIILPIGISFYTFESLTYVVDVYRRVHAPLKRFWDYQLYIILFPKLIAGPIIRYHDIADQIPANQREHSLDTRLAGWYRFVIGLAKKVLISNVMAETADAIFALPTSEISSLTAWIGALAYTFQIYFDFSGYSDMAIGLGRIFGFRFPENFNNPYISTSISDFWRRWHMTLGSWMRNYLYIPLGGNRVNSQLRLYFNLWLVFLASGLWHGASWSFIFWGAYHGFFLVLERAFLGKYLAKMNRVFSVSFTFLAVMIGWVFFRVEDLGEAFHYVQRMFSFTQNGLVQMPDLHFWVMFAIASLFAWFALPEMGQRIQTKIYNANFTMPAHITWSIVIFVLYIYSLAYIVASGFNPFIYFRF